nr:hypothetical protein [uncultured Dyadobacter sp.]
MCRKHLLSLLVVLLAGPVLGQGMEKTYYRSPGLESLTVHSGASPWTIENDEGELVAIQEYRSPDGLIHWYRRVATEVCLTGDCRPIEVGIFWDCTGDFEGLEVFKEPLTKTDHSDFTTWDYRKLVSILKNDWSPLREYALSELVDEKKEEGVDAVTGATKREIAEAAVEKAVYTTHTLWHLIHLGEKEQLAKLTARRLSEGPLLDNLLRPGRARYQPFLLDLFGQGQLPQTPTTESLVFDALANTTDPTLKAPALAALRSLDLSSPEVQDRFATIYQTQNPAQKAEILTVIKPAYPLSKAWYEVLAADLDASNPWMAPKILSVLKNNPYQSEKVMEMLKKLSASDIAVVQKAVQDFQAAQKIHKQ